MLAKVSCVLLTVLAICIGCKVTRIDVREPLSSLPERGSPAEREPGGGRMRQAESPIGRNQIDLVKHEDAEEPSPLDQPDESASADTDEEFPLPPPVPVQPIALEHVVDAV
jgi:hypothetical protein